MENIRFAPKKTAEYLFRIICNKDIEEIKIHDYVVNCYQDNNIKFFHKEAGTDCSIPIAAILTNDMQIIRLIIRNPYTKHSGWELPLLDFVRINNLGIDIYKYLTDIGFIDQLIEYNENEISNEIKAIIDNKNFFKQFIIKFQDASKNMEYIKANIHLLSSEQINQPCIEYQYLPHGSGARTTTNLTILQYVLLNQNIELLQLLLNTRKVKLIDNIFNYCLGKPYLERNCYESIVNKNSTRLIIVKLLIEQCKYNTFGGNDFMTLCKKCTVNEIKDLITELVLDQLNELNEKMMITDINDKNDNNKRLHV